MTRLSDNHHQKLYSNTTLDLLTFPVLTSYTQPLIHGTLLDEFMTFQIRYIILDAPFQISERKEVNGVDSGLVSLGATFLEDTMKVMVRNGEHTAVSMVDNGYFVRAEQLLGNNERAEGSLTIRRGSTLLKNLEGVLTRHRQRYE